MATDSKVIVIGLDGGSWSILDRLIDEGVMPCIKNLVESGVRADLRSTIPPVTPSAWASFATGCNPGKHGIFGFFVPVSSEPYSSTTVSRLNVSVPSLWRMLSGMGRRSVVMNVPVTFPPEKIDGNLISGFMSPGLDSQFTYPKDLKVQLQDWGIDYRLNNRDVPELRDDDVIADEALYETAALSLIDDLLDLTENRWLACKKLSEKEWDLLVCVFYGADRLQHYFWDYMPGNEKDGGRISERIRDFFSRFDNHLGEFVDRWDGVNVLIMSDHGFEKFHGDFLINRWLQKQGMLRVSRRKILQGQAKEILKRLGVKDALMRLRGSGGSTEVVMGREVEAGASGYTKIAEPIDWKKTLAYKDNVNGIRVNLMGREAAGSVKKSEYEAVRDRVIKGLRDLTDESGGTIIDVAERREKAFSGTRTELAPDIVFTFRDHSVYGAYLDRVRSGSEFVRSWKQGDHKLHGIMVGAGPAFRSGTSLSDAWIGDICPTVLYLLGCAIPNHIDGKVLSEAIRPELIELKTPTYTDSYIEQSGDSPDADAGSGNDVGKHLRGLGYID